MLIMLREEKIMTPKTTYTYLLKLPDEMRSVLKYLSYIKRSSINEIITTAVQAELIKQLKTYLNDSRYSTEILAGLEQRIQQIENLQIN